MREIAKAESKGLTEEERKSRLDLRYRTAAGKHIIVELKRYSVRVDAFALLKQMSRYRSALTKILQRPGEPPPHIEVIAVLGQPPSGVDAKQLEGHLREIPGRVIRYDDLISDALDGYSDYLRADERIERIRKIVERI